MCYIRVSTAQGKPPGKPFPEPRSPWVPHSTVPPHPHSPLPPPHTPTPPHPPNNTPTPHHTPPPTPPTPTPPPHPHPVPPNATTGRRKKGGQIKGVSRCFIHAADIGLTGVGEGRSHAEHLLFGGHLLPPFIHSSEPPNAPQSLVPCPARLSGNLGDPGLPGVVVSYSRGQCKWVQILQDLKPYNFYKAKHIQNHKYKSGSGS